MVKQGYKQTELGLLPEEWECREIDSFASVCMCKRIFAGQTSETGEIPFYKIGTFGKKADAYISRRLFEEYKQKYSYPKKGDVLISAAGTLGRTVVYDGEEAYFQDSNIVWLDIDKSQINNDYLYHYYKVIKWTPSEGSTIARLYNSIITSTNVAVPPKQEQEAIAEALSDIDTLIVNLEKLIAKKKAIKQGAMQELLTGKRRLPGFDGEWKVCALEELCDMFSGGTPNSRIGSYYGGDIPWVSISDISVSGKYLINTEKTLTRDGLENSSARLYPAKTLLFAMYASIGKCCIANQSVSSSQAILGIYNFRNVTCQFLYYYLSFNQKTFVEMGQTGTQSNLSKKIVQKIPVFLPELNEQIAIVNILSDMDDELNTLEKNLKKYQMIKQGMMSELLTGNIRLVK